VSPVARLSPDHAQEQAKDSESDFRNKPSSAFPGATLLTKKRREVLVPVTFRIPQSLKEQLNDVARKHELNQTDLINEGIELNLQRYR
jgi:hypothetical protein